MELDNYEITKGTLAVVPLDENYSLVYEDDQCFKVKKTPLKIIEHSCLYFGSSYNGRREGAMNILGGEYKVPVLVNEVDNLIVFPTTSPASSDCVWISLKNLNRIEKEENFRTKVIFNNGKTIEVPISFRTIENQVSRASRLDYFFRNRKNY